MVGLFFELELPYLVIGLFILAVTLFVTTRDFVPKVAFKRGMIIVSSMIATFVALHFYSTTSRMFEVEALFNGGRDIICENRMRKTISQSVILSKKLGWHLEGHLFKNPEYERDFHTSRCIEYVISDYKEPSTKK